MNKEQVTLRKKKNTTSKQEKAVSEIKSGKGK